MLTPSNIDQIKEKGISVDQVNQQIEFFKKGIPFLNINKPATVGDGIIVLEKSAIQELLSEFDSQKSSKTFEKFVPASGAATRMFKSLYEQVSKPAGSELLPDVAELLSSLHLFAFYPDLVDVIENSGNSLAKLEALGDQHAIINYILSEPGLNYGNLPKGLLKFHKYPEGNRSAVEEHLVEGAVYASSANGNVKIHFTVSQEHLDGFKTLINKVIEKYNQQYHVKFIVEFSIQKTSTDTIAVDERNEPFREKDGSLVFRPGGHGALLDNLNDIESDVVFIKNIDNVVPDHRKEITIVYKKALAGLLLKNQKQIFSFLTALEKSPNDDALCRNIVDYIEKNIGYQFDPLFFSKSIKEKSQTLKNVLNRPIRVCGMVKNEGEPGGGPYWVQNMTGERSLQILESSQFDLSNNSQKQIFNKATHFNPVDLIVSLRDYKGEKFDLLKYRDPDTGFIAIKSKDGKPLKALELPGLWNGAMAYWNTIFVEVPIETFNPVKTINDLLRKEHQ